MGLHAARLDAVGRDPRTARPPTATTGYHNYGNYASPSDNYYLPTRTTGNTTTSITTTPHYRVYEKSLDPKNPVQTTNDRLSAVSALAVRGSDVDFFSGNDCVLRI